MANNDDFDDFNEDDFLMDSEPSGKSGGTGGWQSKPGFRIFLAIAVVLVVGVGAYAIFGGDSSSGREESTRIASPSQKDVQNLDVKSQSPNQQRKTIEAETELADQSVETGQSVLPTPLTQDISQEELNDQILEPLDQRGMQVWAQRDFKAENLKEPYQQAVEVQKVLETPPPVPAEPVQVASEPEIVQQTRAVPQPTINVQAVSQRATMMQDQMRAMISAWQPREPVSYDVAMIAVTAADGAQAFSSTGTEAAAGTIDKGDLMITAGRMLYAHMVTEANSDVPSQIVAEIDQGPARGARLIGSFSVSNELLTIEFNTMILDGDEYSVSALVLDPSTTLAGVATDIDRRYFRRVILPAAADFIVGIGEAFSDSKTSVTVSGDTTTTQTEGFDTAEAIAEGASTAAEGVSDMLTEEADRLDTMVRVRAGTPIGVMFLKGVYEGDRT